MQEDSFHRCQGKSMTEVGQTSSLMDLAQFRYTLPFSATPSVVGFKDKGVVTLGKAKSPSWLEF